MKNKYIPLYWVDKLREIIDTNSNDPEKALYSFEDWAINEEKKFNIRYYEGVKEDKKKFNEWLKEKL
jgi:hypothetical protein